MTTLIKQFKVIALTVLLILSGCAKMSDVHALKTDLSAHDDQLAKDREEIESLKNEVSELQEQLKAMSLKHDEDAHTVSELLREMVSGNSEVRKLQAETEKENSDYLFKIDRRLIEVESELTVKADAVKIDNYITELDSRLKIVEKRLKINPN